MESVSQGGGRESKENHSLDEQVEIPGTLLLFCCLCEHWICLHRERACSQQLSRNSPRAGPLSTYVPGPCCARSRLHLVECVTTCWALLSPFKWKRRFSSSLVSVADEKAEVWNPTLQSQAPALVIRAQGSPATRAAPVHLHGFWVMLSWVEL